MIIFCIFYVQIVYNVSNMEDIAIYIEIVFKNGPKLNIQYSSSDDKKSLLKKHCHKHLAL